MSRPVSDKLDAYMALAHPVRRRIVAQLARGERTAGEITRGFDITQPAVSQHLRVLRESKLVSQRRSGQRRVYRLNRSTLEQVQRWVNRCLKL